MRLFFILLLIFLAVLALVGFVFTEIMFKISYRAYQIEKYSPMKHFCDYGNKYKREIVHFQSGENRLQGYIFGESEKAKALIVFSHGIWSGPEEYLTIITWFLDRNYAVFAYDYTAYNGSEGKRANGLLQSPLDQCAALDFIESYDKVKHLKKVTLGHSWGAYATTAGLRFDHDIVAACAMSGFNDPVKISVETAKMMLGPLGELNRPWIWLINRVRFGKYHRMLAVDGINHAGIPVLLTHGRGDDFIRYDISSIVSAREQITNPNLEIYTVEEEGRFGHTDFFLSLDASKYMSSIQKEFEELKKKYKKGNVPEEVKKEFFEKVDKERANAPAEEFFEVIDDFFTRALEKT